MDNYELLRTEETFKNLPKNFITEFEEALSGAMEYWKKHGMLVDQFEDNKMECSFAKGFLAGCIYISRKTHPIKSENK